MTFHKWSALAVLSHGLATTVLGQGLRVSRALGRQPDFISGEEVGTFLVADIQYDQNTQRKLIGKGGNKPEFTYNIETEGGFIFELTNVNPSWVNGKGKGLKSGLSKIKLGKGSPVAGGKIDLNGGNPEVVGGAGGNNGNGNGIGNGNGVGNGNGKSALFQRRNADASDATVQKYLRSSQDQRQLQTTRTKGVRSVLAVRVIASNDQYNFTESELSDEVFGTFGDPLNLVSQYYDCSHGLLTFTKALDKTGIDTSISNGVVTITVATSTSEGDSVMKNAIAAEINAQFNVSSPNDLADHVMYCLPPNTMSGIAYAYINSWNSVYSNEWCNFPSGQMHEIGHNLGFGHSGQDATYDDQSGMMGFSYSTDDGPAMCFNGHKSYYSGWFEEAVATIKPFALSNACFQGKLYGFIDFDAGTPDNKVIVKIEDVNSEYDFYVHFNRKASFNSGTKEGGDLVMISTAGKDGLDYAASKLLSVLSQGDSYTVTNFGGTGNDVAVNVVNIDISAQPAFAEISIIYPGSGCTPYPTVPPTTSPTQGPTIFQLLTVGNNGSPSAVFPLDRCRGDCDNDNECAGSLICFQRTGLEAVPGCPGEGDSGDDYCFELPDKYLWKTGNNGVPAEAFPLGVCRGDCDSDAECAEGLVCLQRLADEPVPGCYGPGKTGEDYCIDPNPNQPSMNPTSAPTRSPSKAPTSPPSSSPTTNRPTTSPTKSPTRSPHKAPTSAPSSAPTTKQPTTSPTSSPIKSPTPAPSNSLATSPTVPPTKSPTPAPSLSPTTPPTAPPSSQLLPLTRVGNNGSPAAVFPLGRCQGDCDNDGECSGSLRCFQRSGVEPILGCLGPGNSGDDYCFDLPPGYLWVAGNNGVPAEAFPLGNCEGDCDSHDDCADGLVCQQRTGNEPVIGCLGLLETAKTGEDYCFVPPENYLFTDGNDGIPADAFPLGLCKGDCDSDAECAEGLICLQRSGDEPVPGCIGPATTGQDYCIATAAPTTLPPTKAPTLAPSSSPTKSPTKSPTRSPSKAPTFAPSSSPTNQPAASPTASPTKKPTLSPTAPPTRSPSKAPTSAPSSSPTTKQPTKIPTTSPTVSPTKSSTPAPSSSPTTPPTAPPSSQLLPLTRVGNNGSPTTVFPLGRCQGDCDNDGECSGALRCFERSGVEPILGCLGPGNSGEDYCFDLPPGYLWVVGNNGVPAEAFPLGNCEGDCDSHDDCADGLVCQERTGDEPVIGCLGLGDTAKTGEDYCFVPPENYLFTDGNNGVPAEAFPLGLCKGDCDSDAECAEGLICLQRSGDEPVPGCIGPATSGQDYCMDPNFPTSSPTTLLPTKLPTPLPTSAPTSTSSPTSSSVPSSSSQNPTCATFTESPTGPPNTISYKPGENNAVSIDGRLRLSEGLLAEVIAVSGSQVELKGLGSGVFSPDTFHSRPDGATVIEKPCGGGWTYVSNSESGDISSYSGGVGAIDFNNNGEVIGYRRILSNTRRNCGGGKMWWGTWVTCEEVSNGLVYEVHPDNDNPNNLRQTLLGATAGNYESVAYDNRPGALFPQDGRPRFFLTEDSSNGPLERFRPSFTVWQDAKQSGDYSNLLHDNTDGTASTDYLLITPASTGALTGTFTWTPNLSSGKANAASYFPNCEGIDIRDGMLYMTCKLRKQLFILNLDAGTYQESSTVSGAFDGQPDQITSIVGAATGNIVYFCEDVGDKAGVHGRDSTGQYYTIAQDEGGFLSGETTGLAFSPNKKWMYVAYQMGQIYKIWRDDGRPFGGTTLDIKYHVDTTGNVFHL